MQAAEAATKRLHGLFSQLSELQHVGENDQAEIAALAAAVEAKRAEVADAEQRLADAQRRVADRPRELEAVKRALAEETAAAVAALQAWSPRPGPLPMLRPPPILTFSPASDDDDPRGRRPADRTVYDTAEASAYRGLDLGGNVPRKPPEDLRVVARRLAFKGQAALNVRKAAMHPAIAAQAAAYFLADWWETLKAEPPPEGLPSETLAGCYRAAEEAAKALAPFLEHPESLDAERGRPLLAAAAAGQSSLRTAATRFLPRSLASDRDQILVFHGVKYLAFARQIYVDRYLRVDDMADASAWKEWIAGIDRCKDRFEDDKQRGKHLQSVRFAGNKLAKGEGDAAALWETLSNRTTQLIRELKMPASNVELREALVPVLEAQEAGRVAAPERISPELEEALACVQAWRAEREDVEEAEAQRPTAPMVVEARRLLEGKRAIFVGGTPDPNAERRIVQAFGLSELEWIATREHQSTAPFEAPVSRPETALVLCALRISGHAFDDDLKEMCDRYGKAYVRLPRGWSVMQVAYETINQASGKLGASA